MPKNTEDTFYEAMLARDHRFDGKFFVGVKTTGIYCRPICPAKPKRANVEFFRNHLEAERAGYRPCLRCRPESAPLSPAWIGKSAVVQRAVKVLNASELLGFDEDSFAAKFGVSARHLRRLFEEEIGKTPRQLAAENRLNLARKLITETRLSLTEIAYAAGFGSVRRFNGAFQLRFKKSPSQIRRSPLHPEGLLLSLPYRPPFHFEGLLATYRRHRVANLEWFGENSMHRVVEFGGKVGTVGISDDAKNSRLLLEINFPDTSAIPMIVAKVRNLFDLDCDPLVIANCLEKDPKIKKLSKKFPGLRLSSGWDPFEIAIATILGQLVSVDRGRALVANLVEMLGADAGITHEEKTVRLFPTPAALARADLSALKTTGARKRTLKAFAAAVANGYISLESTQPVESFTAKILEIPGIGPWTASYMALKVLRDTDSFPVTDLILARALEQYSADCISELSPWRGYAAALFWHENSSTPPRRKPLISR